MAVFDTKRVAKQTSSPEPAAEGAMTLVAPQAAHAEAGVASSRIENGDRILRFCLLLFNLEGASGFWSGRLLLRPPVVHF